MHDLMQPHEQSEPTFYQVSGPPPARPEGVVIDLGNQQRIAELTAERDAARSALRAIVAADDAIDATDARIDGGKYVPYSNIAADERRLDDAIDAARRLLKE